MAPLIERNTTIPTRRAQIFSTATDNQATVEIKVYQGERSLAADNKLLGTFELTGIPPAPRAVPQIEVTFDIDADGLLHVEAKDKTTGRAQRITIRSSSGLSDEDIAQMIADAEANRDADERRHERIALENQADGAIYSAERKLRERGEAVAPELREEIESRIAALRQALSGDDLAAMRNCIGELAAAAAQLVELEEKTGEADGEVGTGGGESEAVPEDEVGA
jgi:molecular chaperone DnaK